MKLAALTLVRNEERMIGFTGRVALQWCDHWVVLLHNCTDGSQKLVEEIATEYPERVTFVIEQGDRWLEMTHRQTLLSIARSIRATHMAIVDADEVLDGTGPPMIRAQIELLAPGAFLRVPMKNLCDEVYFYRNEESVWGRATTVLAFADDPRLQWISRNGYEHHHRHPHESIEGFALAVPSVLHLQMVSQKHLVAKHAWYKMMERVYYPDKDVAEIDRVYSMAPDRSNIELAPIPEEWLAPYAQWAKYLRPHEGEPWHTEACHRMKARFGEETFRGLNLFGVV